MGSRIDGVPLPTDADSFAEEGSPSDDEDGPLDVVDSLVACCEAVEFSWNDTGAEETVPKV